MINEAFGGRLMDADSIGPMVVTAIRNDEPYVFNDPVSRRLLLRHTGKILASHGAGGPIIAYCQRHARHAVYGREPTVIT